ncbi:trypsin-like peptidase domain-containing protein [Streptomyces sp. NPDC005562]|uniref:VMAP-C domain-containing protein n=1 Tax=Streptomyces sp. NPDC005562 TaxID=3154890 RepID=UPI0033AE6857
MSSASWHVRVQCGREVGAGFLVSERHLLTCAHVVRDSGARDSGARDSGARDSAITVSFPHRRTLGRVTATVSAHGGWGGGHDDLGDLAVLELEHPVQLAPAVFAPPEDAYGHPRPRLLVYGFPKGYEEGSLAEYRATAAQLIADEWVQLEAWSAHGQPLAPGFSGAAVTLADSGRVVGMVAAAAGAAGVRNGRMLPTAVMARYWPPLGDLVPTPGHRRAAKERLRALVDRVEDSGAAHDPERLYRDAVGPLGPPVPPEGFGSLWPAAWYVLSEVDDPDAVTRLTDRLGALLDRPAAAPAAQPGITPATEPTALAPSGGPTPGGPPPAWAPILVEIEHSGAGGDQLLVEVSACRDGHRHPVASRTLPGDRVPAFVQERIDEAFSHLAPDADELLAFVLPRPLLDLPVATWPRGADDPTPLGCSYPLVLADRARRAGGLRHQLARKWQNGDGRPAAPLHRIECGTQEKPNRLRFRLRQDDADLAGFTVPPRTPRATPRFDATLNAPVPVLLWPRSGCDAHPYDERRTYDDESRPCDGEGRGGQPRTPGPAPLPGTSGDPDTGANCPGTEFLDRIAAHVDGLPLAELPHAILALRESADAADEPDAHWARDVQLLWDDPRCLPAAPQAPLRSPVA